MEFDDLQRILQRIGEINIAMIGTVKKLREAEKRHALDLRDALQPARDAIDRCVRDLDSTDGGAVK